MTATTIQQRLSRIRKVLRKAPEKRKYRWAWAKAKERDNEHKSNNN